MTLTTWLRSGYRVGLDAFGHFNRDDGWAMASHVALSAILALFPLLIFIAALAGFMGFEGAAATASELLFDAWPDKVAEPVAAEISKVLTVPRGDLLTFGVVAALWFASNGLEAMRTALNRAYRLREKRSFLVLRLQSLVLVVLGAAVLIVYTFLVVLAPLAIATVQKWVPGLEPFLLKIDLARIGIAGSLLAGGLFAAHALLPTGKRRLRDLLPGVAATLAMWMAAGILFGAYLASFANYVSTYAGLAGIMSAIVFLYICSLAFIFGGEINAAMIRQRALADGFRRAGATGE